MKKKLLLLLCFIIFAGSALAAPQENLLIILDCSLSMEEEINGQSKIDIAKNSIKTVLSETPPHVNIGLRVYGHKKDALRSIIGIDTCEVSELIVPIAVNNRQLIFEQLKKLRPVGWTPICYSLEQASINDFINLQGRKRIILVSDGMETCSGNPCKLAVELIRKNPDITIDVIGFDVSSDPSVISNLKCVALATHGKFYAADNPDQFLKSLKQSFSFSREVQSRVIGK